MRALVCVLFMFVASHVNAVQVYDDFSMPKWTAFNTPGVSVYEQSGRLKIDFFRTATGYEIEGGYSSTCRLEGDYDLSVDFYAPVFPLGNGVRVGLITSPVAGTVAPTVDPVGRAISELVANPNESLYLSDFSPIGMDTSSAVITSDTSGRFRIKRVGSELTGYYWDKVARRWVMTGLALSFIADPVYITLASWTRDFYFQKVPVKVAFDNVKITTGNCVKPI
jgi:hypothetical protein